MATNLTVDVAIIGAGGGGYPAAFFLDKAGFRVLMVDPIGNLGGNCLAEGCVPSKAVREASLIRSYAKKYSFFGLLGPSPQVDWNGILAHKDRVQNTRYELHKSEIQQSGILFYKGIGKIVDDRKIEVCTENESFYATFKHLIIATGSRPHTLQIPGAELTVSSHDLFKLESSVPFPTKPIIIGGGYIGVEVASMFENLGCKPSILEFSKSLIGGFDRELSQFLFQKLQSRISIELEAQVKSVKGKEGNYEVIYVKNDQEMSLFGDLVIMATGRECVSPEGIEILGFQHSKALSVTNTLQLYDFPHIYAPGDVNGKSMLFHSAVLQSRITAHNIAAGGQSVARMDWKSVPYAVFTEPEIASVGLTEEEAIHMYGHRIEVIKYEYAIDARAEILGETEGFIKLIFDCEDKRLLGAHIGGIEASQLIAPLALALREGLDAEALARVAFPHPMISEGINKAARTFSP
ncbi:dihydrolipoyl dehydrogenase [Candidatus Methylacidiphilum fumarolicum]|uniref:Dihydrolipoyl dehydrogenase n=2 Tax=Candidatus Methylacidiphilum fumarolicum TaxID=591154 RepID=I0K0K8_METFB|nr:dihydrolipoyl dehydrogenase [Candidatus Methylacidiphilum fumarolicum]MBW6415528.1 dihydrolipoyl dehydrogenase [Candidatus Methylacidiphilum fumarolicum]TFE68132.1 dihydrolipoyl dehydrogenase [Candidatus Methylacidiphilum fumarolicum]TFE73454.1 dihydrolipoyl dehydrogenase [Candidatus Methylacidiphilum fumarolicum]TFE74379.1 dihydrolipoyl dehydrogenase [Candidatus Methylacidiphilum fumarolicum]TFE76938.1 dihydrolipoyl dehydrogenase [Candidatus Methylacidiphilum fumarolicum]